MPRYFYYSDIRSFLRESPETDPTRHPDYYNGTYEYLKQMGFEEIQ